MLAVPSARESASEIFRRYKLDELVRLRTMARRYYIDALASKALALAEDSTSLDPNDLSPLPSSTWLPLSRRHFLNYRDRNHLDLVAARRGLPNLPTRMVYNKRLAGVLAEQREASRRAEALLLSHVLSSNKAILPADEDLEMMAYEATADNADEEPTDNDDANETDEIEEEVRKRRASEREAQKERAKILVQMRAYRRRFGTSRVMTRTMNKLLYDI